MPRPKKTSGKSSPSSVTKRTAEVDLKKQSTPISYTDESLGVHLPSDAPVYLRVHRLLEDRDEGARRPVTELKGWTVQLDAYTFGVKFYVRIGRDGTCRLIIEDEQGREKLAEWEK